VKVLSVPARNDAGVGTVSDRARLVSRISLEARDARLPGSARSGRSISYPVPRLRG
jgi:hypothetical protein